VLSVRIGQRFAPGRCGSGAGSAESRTTIRMRSCCLEEEGLLFLKKKKQRLLFVLGRCGGLAFVSGRNLKIQKFLVLFFKERKSVHA
jgi:hypothetical protein